NCVSLVNRLAAKLVLGFLEQLNLRDVAVLLAGSLAFGAYGTVLPLPELESPGLNFRIDLLLGLRPVPLLERLAHLTRGTTDLDPDPVGTKLGQLCEFWRSRRGRGHGGSRLLLGRGLDRWHASLATPNAPPLLDPAALPYQDENDPANGTRPGRSGFLNYEGGFAGMHKQRVRAGR